MSALGLWQGEWLRDAGAAQFGEVRNTVLRGRTREGEGAHSGVAIDEATGA